MHDTTKRVEIVERRVRYHKTRKSIHRLMVLCGALCFSLLFILHQTSGPAYPVIYGMYGTILLHENVGGYVLVAVICFTAAVVIQRVSKTQVKITCFFCATDFTVLKPKQGKSKISTYVNQVVL